MGLGMFQKHRREREDYALASLAEAVEAAESDEEKEAAQRALDLAKANAERSAVADARRDDASAHGVDVPDWEPTDAAREQEPGQTPEPNADGSMPGEPGTEGTAPQEPPAQPTDPETGQETRQEGETSLDNAGQGAAGVDGDGDAQGAAVAGTENAPEDQRTIEKPNGGASTEAWRTWALDPQGGGKTEEDLKDLGRDAIRDLFA